VGATLTRVQRDLGAEELWARSLERSRRRRAGQVERRSLVSEALLDLDGPVLGRRDRGDRRDLTDPELWDVSQARAVWKRKAAEPRTLPQARKASATLVVAAVAAAVPVSGGAQSRAKSSGAAEVRVQLLRMGSRGPAVAEVQRSLGIVVDGIFGPKTRAAVLAFQRSHGLLVDGIVGPQTRGALFQPVQEQKLIRAWWVAPVQRALGVQVDGVYGPISRKAVRAFQKRNGLVVDGIVGPQTLGALGIRRAPAKEAQPAPPPPKKERKKKEQQPAPPAASSRGERAAAIAQRYLGVPYRWGGESPSTGFDCSGFVQFVLSRVGVSLPRVVSAQYRVGRAVPRRALRPGDLVFFNGLGHVGIAIGGNRFVHSPHSGDVVKISTITGYYAERWVGARRVV
jgi:peptidoglycan DL-endopeptidase CwlO